jgi:hypothetical protein
MEEKSEQKPQQAKGENTTSQSAQNETYLSYTGQLQNSELEVEESKELEEKHGEIENKFNEFLAAINEETLQLSEFLIEEKKLTDELCGLLTQTLRRLKISFYISPEYVAKLGEARQIKLNREGHLIIIREQDKVDSKLLSDYPPDIILTVVWVIIPELEKAMKAYRSRISKRVSLLEKIKQELKNIEKAFSPTEAKSYEQLGEGADRSLIIGES